MEYSPNGSSAFIGENWNYTGISSIKGLLNIDNSEGESVRIGLVGAQGVGKTSLASKLATTIDIPLIEQVSRTVKGLGFKINKNSDIKSQIAIWLGQLHEQLSYTNFITDRTLLDHFAYLSWLDKHNDLGIDKYIVRALGNITSGIMYEQYSTIFYLPICWQPKVNGIRSTDKRYQKEIDEILVYYLNAFGIDFFPLPGSTKHKFDLAMSYIEQTGLLQNLESDDEYEDDNGD